MAANTPAALGYSMPAEWQPHTATWLAWPHNTVTWPDQLPQVQEIYLSMIAALQEREGVHLLVNDAATAGEAWDGSSPAKAVSARWASAMSVRRISERALTVGRMFGSPSAA